MVCPGARHEARFHRRLTVTCFGRALLRRLLPSILSIQLLREQSSWVRRTVSFTSANQYESADNLLYSHSSFLVTLEVEAREYYHRMCRCLGTLGQR